MDVTETREAFIFKADVPGVHEGDLELAIAGDRLTLSGRRDEERHAEHATYFASERSYGAFRRQFLLPAGADLTQLRSELRDGVLTISVPKRARRADRRAAGRAPRKQGEAGSVSLAMSSQPPSRPWLRPAG